METGKTKAINKKKKDPVGLASQLWLDVADLRSVVDGQREGLENAERGMNFLMLGLVVVFFLSVTAIVAAFAP